MDKDYRINIKVRNNRLIKAIEESGGQLGGKWCESKGLNYIKVNDLIRLKDSPLKSNKIDLTDTAYKLCEVLNKSPNDLWSDEQINPLVSNNVSVELSSNQLKQIVMESENEPDKLLELHEMQEKVTKALSFLTPREQKVLTMRYFDDKPVKDIVKHIGVSPVRLHQIEMKALRKLENSEYNFKQYIEG